jgi:predicted ATPase/class 3 adenylate cyclase/DNA-binding CsgD family transcriptional regulator
MRALPTGTVTLLFTDMEGSTRLLQQLGEHYAGTLETCRSLLRGVFLEFDGHEVDTQGDAFFIAFARASDAVAAAVEAQHALSNHFWTEGTTIRVRMGLHTGEPLRSTEGYVGLDVHHAARIMSAGHGGQVLLSHTTRELIEQTLPPGVSVRDLGAHRLKDLQHPSQLFQLVIPGLPSDFPPLKTLDSYPNNLPLQPTPFLGREKEVDAIGQLLLRESSRLVTLTGPGGVGKTRLGLQVAAELTEHFPDGTWFVSLAPLSDPDLVIPTISQVLGLPEARDQAPLEHLRSALHEKKMVLLLDNFEQVVSAATSVADLLAACPRLKVLVTSREGLHVRAEREFPVPALLLPDMKHLPDLAALSQYEAVALFIERAQAVKPEFQVSNANAPAVAEICVRLDGLPLTIELAAARIRLFSPQALLTRLGQRLPLLVSSARDVPARQQTLRKTIQWSYDLLTAAEQRLFRRLAVFVGGCALQAVEAVADSVANEQISVLDMVTSLLDKNLLRQTEQEDGEPWFMLLETIREFGLEALATSGELEAVRHAHAVYSLQLAEVAEPALSGPQQEVWFRRLERELDNFRAALSYVLERGEDRERIEMALRLGASLSDFWVVRSHAQEGWTFLERALERSAGIAVAVRAKALYIAGHSAGWLGNLNRAEELCQQSLALFREGGDVTGVGNALLNLGRISLRKGELATARIRLEESLKLSTETGDKINMAWSLMVLSVVNFDLGDYPQGYSHGEESLLLFRERGNTRGIAYALNQLAYGHLDEGDAVKAHPLYEESSALFKEIGEKTYERRALCGLGRVAFLQGNLSLARSLLEEVSTTFQGEEDPWDQIGKAFALSHLARVVAFEGDYERARALYEQCLAIVKQVVGFKRDTPFHLEGLAAVVAAQGALPWAAHLWGAAEVHRDGTGAPIPPAYRADYERSVASARSQLGEQAFTTAWSEGRSMTLDQVLGEQGKAPVTTPVETAQPARPMTKPSASYPDGLTAREVEVLCFIAKGLTDAQIAEQLVISPRTVNTHLTSIYGKIQVSSRAGATRYAMEHHLV